MESSFKRSTHIFCLICSSLLSFQVLAESVQQPLEQMALKQQAKELIEAFSGDLKNHLKAAIKAGGLKNGIEVCALKAPDIATKYSQQGWQVKRTSLKVRNPANAPSKEEVTVLEIFESGKIGGKDIKDLSYYRVEEKGKKRTHHYMQAIPTQALCLGCHGDTLAPEVQSVLKNIYPADQATGFKEGDIRGAFSLIYSENLSVADSP